MSFGSDTEPPVVFTQAELQEQQKNVNHDSTKFSETTHRDYITN